MASNFNSSGEDDLISGINITPLVDVVLVLLIIFLITAPVIYQAAIKVRLAQASTGESTKDQSVNIAITKAGEMMWNQETVDRRVLEQRLKELGPEISEKTALISADRETPHGIVMELVDTLRAAGLTHLAFNVEKNSPAKPGSHK